MDIGQVNLSIKNDLSKIRDEEERVFFVQMLIALTDVNVFRKLLLYLMRFPKNEILMAANLQVTLNIMFTLAAKLFEGWKLIDVRKIDEKTNKKIGKFSNNWFPKKYSSHLSLKALNSLHFLEDHFKDPDPKKNERASPIKLLRNKIANHHDTEEIKKYLKNNPLSEIELYLPHHSGEIFSTANYQYLKGFLKKIDPSEDKAFRKVLDDIIETSENFCYLIREYLDIVLKNDVNPQNLKNKKIREPRSIDNIHLPFFSK
jgi:hypothetical protein